MRLQLPSSGGMAVPRWVIPVILLSLLQTPLSAVADLASACPLSTCTSCPSAASLSSVTSLTFPGVLYGQYVPRFSRSTNSPTTLIKSSLGTTVDVCCASCTSEADCYFFSWQKLSGDHRSLPEVLRFTSSLLLGMLLLLEYR